MAPNASFMLPWYPGVPSPVARPRFQRKRVPRQREVGAPLGAGGFGARLHASFIAASPIVSGSG